MKRTFLLAIAGWLLASSLAMAGHPAARKPSVLDIPPQGPPPVYGFPGPSTRWGWFGVQYRERQVFHRGYYGNYMSSGYRQGY